MRRKIKTSKNNDLGLYLYIEQGKCVVCDNESEIITIDNSGEEYKTGGICQTCADKEFEKGKGI